jgi:hypothetical protein
MYLIKDTQNKKTSASLFPEQKGLVTDILQSLGVPSRCVQLYQINKRNFQPVATAYILV